MLASLSEKKLHLIRWGLFLAWALLIVSLFYDPISAVLTQPDHSWSWLADPHLATANDPDHCVEVQGFCATLSPAYPISTRVFWGMFIPSAIFVVFVFGHEFWRRICPLYFFSQLPRALGLRPLMNIEQNRWLQNNHFYVQFILFFLGISARILLVNSARPALACLFILTLLAAAGTVALYGGRSWCHYVCPFGMVQTVFTGPRGLLDSAAQTADPYSITQSMCRTVDGAEEQSDCVSCKSACMDIDSELAYWQHLQKPGRRLVQYGYLGLVIGYFCYYGLYAGNFEYYFSGVWSHEVFKLSSWSGPGFYLFHRAIAIPKLVAVPLTLATFATASCWICSRVERYYRGSLKAKQTPEAVEMSLHRMFSLCAFLAFNIFFIYGGRPEIQAWPLVLQLVFQALIAVVSSLWLARTWGRSSRLYEQEKNSAKNRRRLVKLFGKLPVERAQPLGGRSLDHLSAPEVDVLVQTLPRIAAPGMQQTGTNPLPQQASGQSSGRPQNQAPNPPPNQPTQGNQMPLPKTVIKREIPASTLPLPKTIIRNRKPLQ